jgi:hypothetical protein
MWIFLNNSFISIVEYQPPKADITDHLLVRARAEGDIEQFLLGASSKQALAWIKNSAIFTDNTADYHYRLVAPKWLVGECLTAHAESIDYPNFKNSVSDSQRHDAYMEVWSAMYKAYGGY